MAEPKITETRCVGVDGAKRGWIAVWIDSQTIGYGVYCSPSDLLASHNGAAVIAVDVPIGLADREGRIADSLARKFVGGRRACSVFSAPVRGILDAESQPEASRRHREIDGRGFGAQAFGILSKIRDWDELLRNNLVARSVVHEVHPEVSFAALNGSTGLAAGKKSSEGALKREFLLGQVFGEAAVASLLSRVPRRSAAPDDVLDALIALWSARRIADGVAGSLPNPAVLDSAGLRIAIRY